MTVLSMEVNLNIVPISVIQAECRQILSKKLNDKRLFLTDDSVPRDWRGVLHYTQLSNFNVSYFDKKADPLGDVLDRWIQEKSDSATIGHFQQILVKIDRWDVFDDTLDSLRNDAKAYYIEQQQNQTLPGHSLLVAIAEEPAQLAQHSMHNQIENLSATESGNDILMCDSVRSENGLPLEQYDALLLYADVDIDIANYMYGVLTQMNFKICTTSDLLAGTFEHDAIIKLISTRCARVIIILTPNFFQSRANKFFVSFSQLIGIEKGMRKIIPCVFHPSQIPYSLCHLVRLKYNTMSHDNNRPFWYRLRCSLPNYSTTNTGISPNYSTTNTCISYQGNSLAPPAITSALPNITSNSLPITSLNSQNTSTNGVTIQEAKSQNSLIINSPQISQDLNMAYARRLPAQDSEMTVHQQPLPPTRYQSISLSASTNSSSQSHDSGIDSINVRKKKKWFHRFSSSK